MIIPETSSIWVFKTTSNATNRRLQVHENNYSAMYQYDSNSPNHKRVKENDFAILTTKEHVLGIARIAKIETSTGKKTIQRCPWCDKTVERRRTKTPEFRCNGGHEFDSAALRTVDVTRYSASYPGYFFPIQETIPVSVLRRFYFKYNQNLSIQLLKPKFVAAHFTNAFSSLARNEIQTLEIVTTVAEDSVTVYSPNEADERYVIQRQLKERRGQKQFRDAIIKRYGSKCMVTGCKIPDILEAAHINPYKGEKDNHPANGLLLRADIHTLFDLDLIGIHPTSFAVSFHKSVRDKFYILLNKKKLTGIHKHQPNKAALELRWKKFNGSSAR